MIRVQIIGCGAVGSAVAFALICRVVEKFSLNLVDTDADRAESEYHDLRRANRILGVDIPISTTREIQEAEINIICAGHRRMLGEKNQHLFDRNVPIVERILKQVKKDSRVIIVTNPAKEFAKLYDTEFAGQRCDMLCPGRLIMHGKSFTNWGIAAEVVEMI